MELRHPIYAESDIVVDCGDEPPDHTTAKVLQALRDWRPARRLHVALSSTSYDVVVGDGLLARAGALLAPVLPQKRAVVVTDETVAALHLPALLDGLGQTGVTVSTVVVPPGEASKSMEGYTRVVTALLDAGVERRTTVIALGGGVVGDLAGFAAATTLRGLPFVQVPTTLLSQVDSSVGGKTGINTRHGKNLLGAFHQPRMVLADTGVLGTLPPRELRAGYAEIVKAGLIGDAAFFDWCEAHGAALTGGDQDVQAEAVLRACAFKAAVVGDDEREEKPNDGRALLNLGHTFGHALEAEVGYGGGLLHGEAVAAGLGLAFRLSARLGLCEPEDAARVGAHLEAVGLPSGPGMLNRRFSAARLIGAHAARQEDARRRAAFRAGARHRRGVHERRGAGRRRWRRCCGRRGVRPSPRHAPAQPAANHSSGPASPRRHPSVAAPGTVRAGRHRRGPGRGRAGLAAEGPARCSGPCRPVGPMPAAAADTCRVRLSSLARPALLPQLRRQRHPAGHRRAPPARHQARARLVSLRSAGGKMALLLLGLACGASIGREGPTVQVGAAIMFALGRLSPRRQPGLILAGASAGVAAAFNTPPAGFVFGIEEMSRSFEAGPRHRPGDDHRRRLTSLACRATTPISARPCDAGRCEGWLAVPLLGVLGGLRGRRVQPRAGPVRARAAGRGRGGGQAAPRRVRGAVRAGGGVLRPAVRWRRVRHRLCPGARRWCQDGAGTPAAFGVLKLLATLASSVSGIPGGIFAPSLAVGAGLGANVAALLPGAAGAGTGGAGHGGLLRGRGAGAGHGLRHRDRDDQRPRHGAAAYAYRRDRLCLIQAGMP